VSGSGNATSIEHLAASKNPDMVALVSRFTEMWADKASPFIASMMENAGLDVRVRELLIIALLTMKGWEEGVRFHVGSALDAGVEPADIRGAILLTLTVDGIATASRGMRWFESCLESRDDQNERVEAELPRPLIGPSPADRTE
jgi:alkylhydroperoxidase/carboxymuconolactone decarboxylase family protein YurZ